VVIRDSLTIASQAVDYFQGRGKREEGEERGWERIMEKEGGREGGREGGGREEGGGR
jgi:hypothetical protein